MVIKPQHAVVTLSGMLSGAGELQYQLQSMAGTQKEQCLERGGLKMLQVEQYLAHASCAMMKTT